ncbi:hypothetical protein ACFQWF_12050 [Methylorubrum suomiense]
MYKIPFDVGGDLHNPVERRGVISAEPAFHEVRHMAAAQGFGIIANVLEDGDLAPCLPLLITSVRSGSGPAWTGLQTRSG